MQWTGLGAHAIGWSLVSFTRDLSVSYQIVLTISQTMWCRDITNCLATEGDVLEAMKDAEEKSFQVGFQFAFYYGG